MWRIPESGLTKPAIAALFRVCSAGFWAESGNKTRLNTTLSETSDQYTGLAVKPVLHLARPFGNRPAFEADNSPRMRRGFMKCIRNSLGVSVMAMAIAFGAQAASAQTAAEDAAPADTGEIIVTAQKRAENVQNVPLAVSVVGPTQLAAAGVRDFGDLGKISPSLTIRPAEHPVNANVSLRGVGTFAFGI